MFLLQSPQPIKIVKTTFTSSLKNVDFFMKIIKVAQIIDSFTIVINAGLADGLRKGTVVMIYDIGPHIIDPDTGDDLGALEIVKGTGVISHIQDRIATVESNMVESEPRKIIRQSVPGALSGLDKMFGSVKTEEVPVQKKTFTDPQIGSLIKVIR